MMVRTVCLFLLAGIVTPASATLIEHETFSRDIEIGLDWLKMGALAGYSYDQVSAGALGFTTSGWRYATKVEVIDLFTRHIGVQNDAYFTSPTGPNALSSSYFVGADDLVVKLGMNFAFNDSRARLNSTGIPGLHQISVQGMFDDGLPGDSRQGFAEATAVIADATGIYADLPESVPLGRWGVTADIIPIDSNSGTRSSFLVRAVSVPEPGTLALFGMGLAAMGLSKRRNKV